MRSFLNKLRRADAENLRRERRLAVERAAQELAARAAAEERRSRDGTAAVQALTTRQRDLVERFLEVAERKVSAIDEYGDESWEQLPKEIQRCVLKIADREGADLANVRKWLKNEDTLESVVELSGEERLYRELAVRLGRIFQRHHDKQKHASPLSLERVDGMTGAEFETLLASILRRIGFEDVRGTPASGDQGADLIARRDGRTIVVQAKRSSSPVSNKAVQEVVAALRFYSGHDAWVVTNSTFTKAARSLARSNHVTLVDRSLLEKMLAEAQ